MRPRVEEYCNVWLDCSSANHHVAETECISVWKGILKYWLISPSEVETIMGSKGLKFPTQKRNGDLFKLNPPSDVFVPDDLELTALFKRTSARSIFAWHPNPSDFEIPLHFLFSLYNSLGVKNISEVAQKNEVSISNDASLRKLQRGEGFFRGGLYRIVFAYLAYPSFNISADKRHGMVKTLLELPAYEIAEPLAVSYTLALRTEDGDPENIVATATSFVRWEKENNRILLKMPNRHNPKVRLSLATEFAEVVSKGLLSADPILVAGLCEMLKMGCILEFEDEVVDEMLQHKSMQLFKEDEHFLLLQGFPRLP
ncbi:hypothetical protein SUGI_0965480 [Cryptomeria japonica]|nr:hypothetical protein SUGI_0965480 [Cryptomeria japonica]